MCHSFCHTLLWGESELLPHATRKLCHLTDTSTNQPLIVCGVCVCLCLFAGMRVLCVCVHVMMCVCAVCVVCVCVCVRVSDRGGEGKVASRGIVRSRHEGDWKAEKYM